MRIVRKRAVAKGKKTVKSRLSKYQLECLQRQRREEVPDKNFLLREMAWSNWRRVISPEVKGECCHKRTQGLGYQAPKIFSHHLREPAVYEIAVKPKYRCRKVVLFGKCCKYGLEGGLCWCNANWERKLFHCKDMLLRQIDSVVKKGCDIFIRRAILDSENQGDDIKLLLKKYDYAWSVQRYVRKCHRPVTRANVDISEEMEI